MYPEKGQRWVPFAQTIPQTGGEGITRHILAYTDGLMCVENRFEAGAVGSLHSHPHISFPLPISQQCSRS